MPFWMLSYIPSSLIDADSLKMLNYYCGDGFIKGDIPAPPPP
jgi:hypothetical protein